LQLELAEAERLRVLKEERATARMRLKVSHVAAMYIQFVWRRRTEARKAWEERRNRAGLVVARSVQQYVHRLKRLRMAAARRIQLLWRAHASRQQYSHHLQVLHRFLLKWISSCRMTSHFASVLQKWYRSTKQRQRATSIRVIRQIWRRRCLWRAVQCFVQAFLDKKRAEKIDRCARVLQRSLGQFTVYRRLVATPELVEFPSVMAHPWRGHTGIAGTKDAAALESSQSIARKLKTRETTLATEVEQLARQLETAKTALTDEREKLRRHASVEEYRRVKDEQVSLQRLQETEVGMRRQIRMEIERELETARRLMLRRASGSGSTLVAIGSSDPRLEIA